MSSRDYATNWFSDVHGIMYGEAMKDMRENELRKFPII